MTERCLTLGCPEVVRIAQVDSCTGEVQRGGETGYALSCIRNWSIEPIVREGEVSEFTSDCGSVVARDKQDDQLLGYTISFESALRSNELEALVTGKELISDGTNNIGTYAVASNVGCTSPTEDPRFILEVFYKLSKCVTEANHVRVVLPAVQFKVTELDREGSITYYRYTAETGITPANTLGEGPYQDFPADVTAFLADREDEYTAGFDFEESIEISGSCGVIEVPEAGVPPTVDNWSINFDPDDRSNFFSIIGTGFDDPDNPVTSVFVSPRYLAIPNFSVPFTVVDDTEIIVNYTGPIILTDDFIVNTAAGSDNLAGVGWFVGEFPDITLADNTVTITDPNGSGDGSFASQLDLHTVRLQDAGNLDVGQSPYALVDPERTEDGVDSITITDPLLNGATVAAITFPPGNPIPITAFSTVEMPFVVP